jgi:tight adherence protein C
MELVLLTFLAVFLLLMSGALLVFRGRELRSRLAQVVLPSSESAEGARRKILSRPSPNSLERVLDPFQRVLPRSPEEVSVIQKRLIWAGFRKDVHVKIFYGLKVLVPAALVAAATLTRAYEYGPFFVYGIAGGLGFLIPDFWLGHLIHSRQEKLRLGLPEALDLMVICIEAGLGLDQAVVRVADELALSQPEIAGELQLVNLEQRAGRPRADAWRNLAERTDVDSVRALSAMLIQADHFGTSIAKSLRIHSDGLRTQRRQQAEEEAARTTVKLVFPLVFCIFPSLFVVLLGPSMLIMNESFQKYLLGG